MEQIRSARVLFARLTWMFFGPIALLLATLAILTNQGGWATVADVVFLIALIAMAVGRVVEFRAGNAQTATGEPATASDLRRYLIGLAIIGPVIFLAANLMGQHWVTW